MGNLNLPVVWGWETAWLANEEMAATKIDRTGHWPSKQKLHILKRNQNGRTEGQGEQKE